MSIGLQLNMISAGKYSITHDRTILANISRNYEYIKPGIFWQRGYKVEFTEIGKSVFNVSNNRLIKNLKELNDLGTFTNYPGPLNVLGK